MMTEKMVLARSCCTSYRRWKSKTSFSLSVFGIMVSKSEASKLKAVNFSGSLLREVESCSIRFKSRFTKKRLTNFK